jgi:hypothetical protein
MPAQVTLVRVCMVPWQRHLPQHGDLCFTFLFRPRVFRQSFKFWAAYYPNLPNELGRTAWMKLFFSIGWRELIIWKSPPNSSDSRNLIWPDDPLIIRILLHAICYWTMDGLVSWRPPTRQVSCRTIQSMVAGTTTIFGPLMVLQLSLLFT